MGFWNCSIILLVLYKTNLLKISLQKVVEFLRFRRKIHSGYINAGRTIRNWNIQSEKRFSDSNFSGCKLISFFIPSHLRNDSQNALYFLNLLYFKPRKFWLPLLQKWLPSVCTHIPSFSGMLIDINIFLDFPRKTICKKDPISNNCFSSLMLGHFQNLSS